MLQKLKTWDFAARFLTRQNRIKARCKPGTQLYKQSMSEFGAWTKDQLVELGPTFIKLGQLASTRRDIYTLEFIEELQSLQDQVPPIPEDAVVDILESEVPSDTFLTFDTKPLKSASLGQVHVATLSNGLEVVVKVQRPDIYEIVDRDVKNIIEVLTVLDALGIDTGPSAKDLFVEATVYLYRELDYITEANNAIRFYKNFYGTPWVRIPRVYSKVLTKKVIVMERVDATKITQVDESMKVTSSKALVNSFLSQLMYHGFFHGDPHPGNVGVNEGGQLVYYDFGLMIELQSGMKEKLLELIPLIIQKNTREIVDRLVDMKIIVPTADKADIVAFLDAAIEFLQKLDGKQFNARMAQDELSATLADQKPFQIPSDFLFLAKSFTTIDGICQQLDPSFNFIDYIEPMIEDDIQNSINLGDITRVSIEMPGRVKSMSESISELERSRNQLKRSIEKSGRDMRTIQYSILSAILADNFVDQPAIFGACLLATAYFVFTGQKSR